MQELRLNLSSSLSGESFKLKSAKNEARSDVKCIGFWTRMRQAYFDIKVVSPYARSYSSLSPPQFFRQAEQSKIREYAARIREVEHADFSPLVFSTTGVMGPQAQKIFKKVAEKMSEIKDIPYSVVCGWMRCRFSFALLRTTLICLRGTRDRKGKAGKPQIERAVVEARIVSSHTGRRKRRENGKSFFAGFCFHGRKGFDF